MLTISFDNVWAKVEGPSGEIARLSHALSYIPKGSRYWSNNTGGKEIRFSMFNSKFDTFPTGLIDFIVNGKHKWKDPTTEEIKHYSIQAELIDRRVSVPIDYQDINLWNEKTSSKIELRDFQKESIAAFLAIKRGIIRVPTGSGKTLIGIALTQKLNTDTLFVVNNKSLLKQTVNEYKRKMRVDVGTIGDNTWEPKKITVATVQTLSRRIEERYVQEFLGTIRFVIFDEVHHASKTYQTISRLMKNAHYRLGLSATALMGDKESKLQSMAITGGLIYDLKMKQLVDNKQLAKPTAIFIDIQDDHNYSGMEWEDLYTEGVVQNDFRNDILCLAIIKMRERGYSSLILVEKIEHGKVLLKKLGEYAPQYRAQYISGANTTNQREDAKTALQGGSLDFLITTRVFNEGVDIPMLESVVIASGYKAAGLTYQRYGRGTKKTDKKDHTIIIDCYDSFNGLLQKHSDERLKVCRRDEAFDIHIIGFNQISDTLDEIFRNRKGASSC